MATPSRSPIQGPRRLRLAILAVAPLHPAAAVARHRAQARDGFTVRDSASRPAIFIDPDATAAHVALMRRRHIRSLIVSRREQYGSLQRRHPGQDRRRREGLDDGRAIVTTPLRRQPGLFLRKCSVKMKRSGAPIPGVDATPSSDDSAVTSSSPSGVRWGDMSPLASRRRRCTERLNEQPAWPRGC
jgi:hypothetical protein